MKVTRARSLNGTLRPPSDKSLTHRAFLFAAMAKGGPSRIGNPLLGEDCLATADCLAEMGADIEVFEDNEFDSIPFAIVSPATEWSNPDIALDCGNSGTTIRLLAGVIASKHGLAATLTGDASLSRRPMRRITEPLAQMGASIEGDTPPLNIEGRLLTGIRYMSPVASAQVKSCLLLAGLSATGETWVSEPSRSRDHTERMFDALGIELLREGDLAVGVRGGQTLSPLDFNVPADISSAAFFMVAAVAVPGALVELREVGVNPTRTGILDVLTECGATFEVRSLREEVGEPVADIVVTNGPEPKPFEIGGDLVPRLIDEIPVLAVLATQCRGVSKIRDAKELRVKESDRIETVAYGLGAMGARVETYDDGMDVHGPVQLKGTTIDATGDHRIAMAFAIAGLLAEGETTILNAQSVETSYPNFQRDLESLTSA